MAELTLSDMLPEILLHIFSYCSREDLLNLILVEVEGSCILGELSNLIKLDMSFTDIKDINLHRICTSTIELHTLILHGCEDVTNMAFSYISMQHSLKTLNLSYTQVTTNSLIRNFGPLVAILMNNYLYY